MTTQDPLQGLLVSETQAIDRQELADLLMPYLSIHKETKSFDFSSRFRDLPNNEKILIILAANKARSLISEEVVDEITPSELIKMDIMPEGSVKGTLKALLDARDIKSVSGKYYLPNYKLSQAAARIKKISTEK